MGSHRSQRPTFKARRTGRHTHPSKTAAAATKAAPVAVIVGALVATAPQAHAAAAAAAATGSRHPHHHEARRADRHTRHLRHLAYLRAIRDGHGRVTVDEARTWTVRPGNTLSGIAGVVYGDPARWTWIFDANRWLANPNVIEPGQVLVIPDGPGTSRAVTVTSYSSGLSGTLGCYQLQELWDEAGGARWASFTAAEVATAESGGRQYAVSPTDDWGYWQINQPSHPGLVTFNPLGNARAAIIISDDGSNWYAWTTYRDGAYRGQC
jgi:Lysozyme like domain/LysM domain